jgi:hypothetical protein
MIDGKLQILYLVNLEKKVESIYTLMGLLEAGGMRELRNEIFYYLFVSKTAYKSKIFINRETLNSYEFNKEMLAGLRRR